MPAVNRKRQAVQSKIADWSVKLDTATSDTEDARFGFGMFLLRMKFLDPYSLAGGRILLGMASCTSVILFAYFDSSVLLRANFQNPDPRPGLFSFYNCRFPFLVLCIHLCCSFLFTVGANTKLAQIAVILFHYSLNAQYSADEGDALIFHLLVLTLCLPTSEVWALDAGKSGHIPFICSFLLLFTSWKISSFFLFLSASIPLFLSSRFKFSLSASTHGKRTYFKTDLISSALSSHGVYFLLWGFFTFRVMLNKVQHDQWTLHLNALNNILSWNTSTSFGRWLRLFIPDLLKIITFCIPIIELVAPVIIYLRIRVWMTCCAILGLFAIQICSELVLVTDASSIACVSLLVLFIPCQVWELLQIKSKKRKKAQPTMEYDAWTLIRIVFACIVFFNEALNSMGPYIFSSLALPAVFHLTDCWEAFSEAKLDFRWWRVGGLANDTVLDLPLSLSHTAEMEMDWWEYPRGIKQWVNGFPTSRLARYHDSVYDQINIEQWAMFWCQNPDVSDIAIVLQTYKSDLQRDQVASSDDVSTLRRLLTSTEQDVVYVDSCNTDGTSSDSSWLWSSFFTVVNPQIDVDPEEACFQEDEFMCNDNKEAISLGQHIHFHFYHYRVKSGVSVAVDGIKECERTCLAWPECTHYLWKDGRCLISWTCTYESATFPSSKHKSVFKKKCNADPLPYCEAVLDWEVGLATSCDYYTRGSHGFYRCWADEYKGHLAYDVCPQCTRCRLKEIPEPRTISPMMLDLKKKKKMSHRRRRKDVPNLHPLGDSMDALEDVRVENKQVYDFDVGDLQEGNIETDQEMYDLDISNSPVAVKEAAPASDVDLGVLVSGDFEQAETINGEQQLLYDADIDLHDLLKNFEDAEAGSDFDLDELLSDLEGAEMIDDEHMYDIDLDDFLLSDLEGAETEGEFLLAELLDGLNERQLVDDQDLYDFDLGDLLSNVELEAAKVEDEIYDIDAELEKTTRKPMRLQRYQEKPSQNKRKSKRKKRKVSN